LWLGARALCERNDNGLMQLRRRVKKKKGGLFLFSYARGFESIGFLAYRLERASEAEASRASFGCCWGHVRWESSDDCRHPFKGLHVTLV